MKTTIFSAISFIAFLFLTTNCKAQFLQDNNGTAYRVVKYEDVKGTPFYNSEWLTGTVKLKNGSSFKNVSLKFNSYDQVVIFKSQTGVELAFVQPVEEFTVVNNGETVHFKNFFNGPNSKSGNAFYQIMYSGSTTLLKTVNKDITSTVDYGSSVTNKEFVDVKPAYFSLDSSNKPVRLKLDKKSILAIFSADKRAKIEDFINKNNLSFKEEKDVLSLFKYANTI